MYVTVQISPEDLTFIYEQLAKLRDKWKEEIKHIEKILKELDQAIKKQKGRQASNGS